MELLKKHYEKILLGFVLVGLAAAVGFLYFKVNSEKTALAEITSTKLNPRVKELPPLNLAPAEAALARLGTPLKLDFSEPNKLFNPMPWQKTAPPDEHLIPSTRVGPVAAVVTNITPLYLRLTLDSVSVQDTGTKYVIGVQKEDAPTRVGRNKKQFYCAPDSKNDTFAVVEVKGKPEDPTEIVIRMNDTGKLGVIAPDKPFLRVEGYTATILYPPENRTFDDERVGAVLKFASEDYKIVAINEKEVVLSAQSNGKKWTIKSNQNAAP